MQAFSVFLSSSLVYWAGLSVLFFIFENELEWLPMINEALGITRNAAEHGPGVDQMLEYVHWFMFVLFVGWTSFFVYVLFLLTARPQTRCPLGEVTVA